MSRTYIYSRAHIIFSTKHRQKFLKKKYEGRLIGYIGALIKEQKGKLLEANTMPDHIHLYVSLRSDPSISTIMRLVKTNSSKWMKETFEHYGNFSWQLGYGYFSVSPSKEAKTLSYIRNQTKHHGQISFKEEFIVFFGKTQN